jgi:hypothetical protein
MRLWFNILFVVCVINTGLRGVVYAQSLTPNADPTSLEQLLEFIARDNSISPQLDLIEHYAQQPLSLRKATPQDLTALSGLPIATARSIVRYARSTANPTFEGMAAALRLSPEQVALLKFCTYIDKERDKNGNGTSNAAIHTPSKKNQSSPHGEFRYRVRAASYLIQPKGLTNGAFQGDGFSLYQRLTYSHGDHAAGITLQKDAGERSVADFITGFATTSFGSSTATVRVVAGDFLVLGGMGSLLWSAFGARKGADVIAPAAQVGFGILPYRSVVEQQFFRGAAAQGTFKMSDKSSLSVMAWASSLGRAATIDTERDVATSLDFDGYFRTASEIAKRNALQEQCAGLGAELRTQTDWMGTSPVLALGGTAHLLDYTLPVVSRSMQSFFGQRGVFASVYAAAHTGNGAFAAELARDGNGNIGGQCGLQTHAPLYDAALAFRSFPAAFRAPFGFNFGESSRPTNEQGLYMGFVWKGWERLRVASYLDLFASPEPTSTVPVPIRGVDAFTEWRFEATRSTILLARASYEKKTDAATIRIDSKTSERVVFGRERAALRLEASFEATPTLRLRARAEGALVASENVKPTEGGAMSFAELSWKPLNGLRVTARASVYRTASFDSAIYQFEPHVAGVLANSALFGTGARYLLLVGYEPSKWLGVWFRGEATVKDGVKSLGSGQLEIPGNTDARLTAQIEIRL